MPGLRNSVDAWKLKVNARVTCPSRFAGVALIKKAYTTGKLDADGEEIWCVELKRESRSIPMDPTYLYSIDPIVIEAEVVPSTDEGSASASSQAASSRRRPNRHGHDAR